MIYKSEAPLHFIELLVGIVEVQRRFPHARPTLVVSEDNHRTALALCRDTSVPLTDGRDVEYPLDCRVDPELAAGEWGLVLD